MARAAYVRVISAANMNAVPVFDEQVIESGVGANTNVMVSFEKMVVQTPTSRR